jgi:hypothetical protein
MIGRVVPTPQPDDCSALFATAREHRVDQLAARAIRSNGGDLAAWFGEHASDLANERTCAVIESVRLRELQTVIECLSDVDGVAPVVFKGSALAHSHYDAPWLRPRLDSDILVAPAHVQSAISALEQIGYTRTLSTSGALVLSQASLVRVDQFGIEHALDVHWKIANWHAVATALSHDEVAGRAVALAALGPRARAAANVDALLIACMHRAAHHRDSEELLWICDIHLIAQRLSDPEWIQVVANASRAKVKALCRRGLALAVDRFDCAVPSEVLRSLETLISEPSAVFLSRHFRPMTGLRSDLHALPASGKLRLLLEHLFPPAMYIRERYQVTSRTAIAVAYARRIAIGLPRWFTTGTDR